jgi:glycosyltransferase involved in cell wall biosynthesis
LRLKDHGVEPHFISANLTDSPPRDVVEGLPLDRLRVCKTPDLQIPSFWASLVWFLWRNRRRYDLIHCHGTFQHGMASPMGRLLGKPTILKIAMGNSDIAFHKHGRLWGRVNRFLVSRFDRYVATSEEVRQECLDRGLDPARIRLIPNGVDTDRFHPPADAQGRSGVRQQLGLRDVPTVCYVGVIDARKNLDGILRIWKAVRDRTSLGQLVLVGPRPRGEEMTPGEFHKRLLGYIADNGLEDSVVFAGAQQDVPGWLRAADIFLFPSKREGMPNALLEAMASGLACVASKIGGSVDIIEHGVDGYLFDVDDEAGMAATIENLLQDEQRAASVAMAARNKATRTFSLRVIADRYSKLYAELLGRPLSPA